MKYLTIIFVLAVTSCANLEDRNKQRDIQSKIIRLIGEQNSRYFKCAKDNKIFALKQKDRVKVNMEVTLNSDGQINKFKISDNTFPDKFVDCMFNVTDLIDFPQLEENEVIELVQPFAFSN